MNFKGNLSQKVFVANICLSKFDSNEELTDAKEEEEEGSKTFFHCVISVDVNF